MQDDRYPFAPPPLPGDSTKPRHRRRTRGHGKTHGGQNQPAQAGAQSAAKGQASPRPPQQNAAPQREGGQRGRRGGTATPTSQPATAEPSARSAQPSGASPSPAQPPRGSRSTQQNRANTPNTQPGRRPAATPREEDPGLLLITRRPPKQKFANFEEYIAAHGGVTQPVPEPEE